MKSMTGFGKNQIELASGLLTIELKAVNHRFLDIQFRLPREFNEYEMSMRQIIKSQVSRGRIECFVNYQKDSTETKELEIQWVLFDSLVKQVDHALKTEYQELDIKVGELVNGIGTHADFFKVVEKKEVEDDLEGLLLEALTKALTHFNLNREQEGQEIQQILIETARDLEVSIAALQKLAQLSEVEHQTKLTMKLTDLIGEQVDESRLLTEIAILVEKGDIQEELDRLRIHVKKMLELLRKEVAVGRELDFLIQEMNREINTIGSKTSAMKMKQGVIQMKTDLEKIREQIQNVE